MRKLAFACVVLLTSGMVAALAADVSGTWAIRGPVTPVCTFVQDGNNLSGACRGPGAEGPLTGTVDGQSLRWTFTRTNMASGRGIAPLTFSASLDGQNLSGTMTLNGANPAPFTAQRMPGAPPIILSNNKPAAQGSPSTTPAAAGVNTNPPPSVFLMTPEGAAVHRQSHLVCPGAIAGFQRVSAHMYGRPGFDVSCGYRAGNAPGSAVVTLYMTLSPREPVDALFEMAKASLVQTAPGVVARTAMAAAPPGFDWLKAGYTMPNGLVTEVFLTRLSGWDYKLRTTYRPEDESAVGNLLAALSAGVARTVAPYLAACAASPPGPRNGQRNQDLAVLQTLTVVSAVVATRALTAPGPETAWCAETGFTVGEAAFIHWRNISGADGPVDRITRINGGDTVLVLRDPPTLVNEMAAKLPSPGSINGRAVYAVVVDGQENMQIVGIFEGRPSLNDVAGLALGKAVGIYGQVSKQPGNPVTIYRPF